MGVSKIRSYRPQAVERVNSLKQHRKNKKKSHTHTKNLPFSKPAISAEPSVIPKLFLI